MNEAKFFKVHASVTILGSAYRPGVCYPMTNAVRATIEQMSRDGMAQMFAEEVRIISGQVYPLRGPAGPAIQPVKADAIPGVPSPSAPGKAKAPPAASRGAVTAANAPGTSLEKVTDATSGMAGVPGKGKDFF